MKKKYVLRISEQDYSQCRAAVLADLPEESAAFMLAGRKLVSGTEELIVRRLIKLPPLEYRYKDSAHLDISPRAINGLISLCERNGLGVVLCHSHPLDTPYSPSDDIGERRIAETLRKNVPNMPVGSLLVSPNVVRARVWNEAGHATEVSELTVVGSHLKKIFTGEEQLSENDVSPDIYDRQILAFGKKGQDVIASMKVGIVGLGGTGSPTAEQLVRMGVRDFVLIDPDVFTASNITRIYGSNYSDVSSSWYRIFKWVRKSKPKVTLITQHLKAINPAVKICPIYDTVVSNHAAEALLDRDIIFCCTDEHWGRAVVNQLSYQYLIPVINMGVRIDSRDGRIRGAAGSIHILRPEKPCLWCYEFLSADRIRAESLPHHEREALLREGYVENIDTQAPSVISLTTTLSGHAVTAFLQLVTNFMGTAGDISCLNYFIMEGCIGRGHTSINEQCLCKKVKGYGDFKSLPTY